jgi:ribosomal protein S18 acetylase RimI-like enzyme
MTFTVRPATTADIPAILPMVQAICDMHAAMDPDRYSFVPDVVNRYATWLPKRIADPQSVVLIAQSLSQSTDQSAEPNPAPHIIAFLIAETLDEIPIYLTKQFGFIHDLWVQPEHRNQGIAQALARECLTRFRTMNLTQVRLDTAAQNDAARALFQQLGFRPSATQLLITL